MSKENTERQPGDTVQSESADDIGGLHAPPDLHGWGKAWWWFHFLILVNLARFRFIVILIVIGVIIMKWDMLTAYYDRWTRPANAAEASGSDVEYFCPMHPSVIRDNPREKCPICFMPLSKRKKGSGNPEVLPAGVVSRLQLSPYRIVLAGIQTWPVDYQPLTKEVTAIGYVEFNERGQRTVSARVAGRIDTLIANETGQMVDAGDELALLYSPDLVVTVQNLLDAKRTGNKQLMDGARARLELLGIDPEQIGDILATDKPDTHLKIRSPISGHIINKYVREGQYVQEGTPLYDLADLSTVWIQAQIYEDDLSILPIDYGKRSGMPEPGDVEVTAKTRAFPEEEFRGKLAFIYPHVDQDTRTVTVRFELKNPGHKLRPGSTASVTLKVKPKDLPLFSKITGDERQQKMLKEGRILAVPEASVIDTGSQRIVYREATPGLFEALEVTIGPRMAGPTGATFYPVLKGLSQGERVVTTGSFLVDAETRLNPAAGSIYIGGSGGTQVAGSATTRSSTPEDPDSKINAALATLSPEDRKVAESQRFCPILSANRLGVMGSPVKLTIKGQTVFLCCSGCTDKALANPDSTLAKVASLKAQNAKPEAESNNGAGKMETKEEAEIKAAMSELSPEDRQLAEAQRYCVVLKENRLGIMGKPFKVVVNGEPVFLCCEGCKDDALAKPAETAAKVREMRAASKKVTK